MNERIIELLNQVGTDASGKWISVSDAEKFAELIVKECANIAWEHWLDTEDESARTPILKFFDVK